MWKLFPSYARSLTTMTTTHYALRAIDCFGDSWPLTSPLSGIDGLRHETLADAQAAAEKYTTDKDTRRAFRQANGWQAGTIRKLEIIEVQAT